MLEDPMVSFLNSISDASISTHENVVPENVLPEEGPGESVSVHTLDEEATKSFMNFSQTIPKTEETPDKK